MTSPPVRDRLYYDGQCPICAREMQQLRKLKDDDLTLVNIHGLSPEPGMPSTETLLKVLHLRRGGEWLTGVDASVAAWQHTRYGYLWQWMRWPVIRFFIDAIYDRWALRRFRRLYPLRCHQNDSCS